MADPQIWLLLGALIGAATTAALFVVMRWRASHSRAREDELRDFEVMASLVKDWFWATDEQHRYENVFGRFDATERSPLKPIEGRCRWDLACPDDLAENAAKWQRHREDLDNHRAFDNFPLVVRKPNGKQAILAVSGRPVFKPNGEFRGYRGIARDITNDIVDQQRFTVERNRLADALEAVDTGIALFDADDRLILHNRRMTELLPDSGEILVKGASRSDIRCRLIKQADDTATVEPAESGVDGALCDLGLEDGRCLQISERTTSAGQTIVAATDISAINRQAREAELATQKLETTLQNIDQGLIVLDAEGRLTTWNQQVFRLLGLPEDTAWPGMHIRDMIRTISDHGLYGSPLSENDIDRRCRSIMSCDPVQAEVRMPGGRILDNRRTRMPDGGIALTTTDISVLKQRESELARTSRALEIVFDTISEGIALLNRDHQLVSVNDRMLELIRLSREELGDGDPITRYCRACVTAGETGMESAEMKIRECEEHYRTGQTFILESTESDGRAIEFEVNPTADGGRVVTCRDMTDRRRHVLELSEAKELAELANRAKTEFLANTSHELRTPLNAIIGFAEMILTQTFGPLGSHKYQEYARDIRDSGSHLLSLINDLLDLAKIESGHHELFEAPLSLPDLLNNCIRLVRERADTGKVKLATILDERVSTIFADERAMKQILINLLSNAVKFTPPGGRVTVTNRRLADGSVEIAVADTGIGMSEGEIPKALSPFGQIEGDLSRRFEGTGLGLPLAQRLIQRHGGTLTIESEKNVGTTVILHLPADRHVAHLGDQLADRQIKAS